MTNKTRSIAVLVIGFLSFVVVCWMVNPARPTGQKWPEPIALDTPVNIESDGEIRVVVEPIVIVEEGPGAARRRPAAVSEAIKLLPQSDANRKEYIPLQREHKTRSVSIRANQELVGRSNRGRVSR